MKAKMISFCGEKDYDITPMSDNLHDALNRARGTNATFISRDQDYNGRESWIMHTISCEKVLAKAASTILKNSLPILEKAGYTGFPMQEAIEWFESQYSLYPKAKPELCMTDRSNELYLKGIKGSAEVYARELAFERFDKSPIYIISCFLGCRHECEHLEGEIREILNMIEREIDRHIK